MRTGRHCALRRDWPRLPSPSATISRRRCPSLCVRIFGVQVSSRAFIEARTYQARRSPCFLPCLFSPHARPMLWFPPCPSGEWHRMCTVSGQRNACASGCACPRSRCRFGPASCRTRRAPPRSSRRCATPRSSARYGTAVARRGESSTPNPHTPRRLDRCATPRSSGRY